MNQDEIAKQTKLAFDFIQKLYFETSYLIKEMEGLFAEEKETQFILCRPAGYNITTRSSNGIESSLVNLWLLKKLSVAFVQKEAFVLDRGQSVTKLLPETKVIYIRIILDDKDITQPTLYYGTLYNFRKKNPTNKWPTKFEQLMTHFEYNESKVFANPTAIDYEDGYVSFKGRLVGIPLFDLNSSEAIYEKIIQPAIKMYQEF